MKISAWILALSMGVFGVLKFFSPFKDWYAVQVAASELGAGAYAAGIAGEIGVGLGLAGLLHYAERIPHTVYFRLSVLMYGAVLVMMAVAVYVHLHPGVPAAVLPLKVKPPIIPLAFGGLAAGWLYRSLRNL
jgi:hypothetical protein